MVATIRHTIAARPYRGLRLVITAATMVVLLLLSAGCSQPDTLTEIRREGTLHVITRESPSVYYEGKNGPTGFEYELASRLADRLGVELRVRVVDKYDTIYSVLEKGYAHIAMGGFAKAPALGNAFKTVNTSLEVNSTVIFNRDAHPARSPEDLNGRVIHTVRGSNHIQPLKRLQRDNESIRWIPHPELDTVDLLKKVNTGEIQVAVVDSTDLALNHVYFPDVKEGFDLTEKRPVVWLMPKNQDDSLKKFAQQTMRDLLRAGTLDHLHERFFGHLDRLDYVGARTFLYHVRNRLPRYEKLFRQTARRHDLDWRLLAAIGYQESHWRPNAVSPTGVRGLMMLTRATARYVGINNRRDPAQSIKGGAEYFDHMRERMPESITEPDRTWFALAAYNVGIGHLEDARKLTEGGGDDPDRWADVKEYLPLLAKRKWYTKTRHGYARGYEPVVYVQNIRRFYDVLRWLNPSEAEKATDEGPPVIPPLPSLEMTGSDSRQAKKPTAPTIEGVMGETPSTL